jgi:Fic family protein
MPYIYQNKNWPKFKWKNDEIISLLSEARNLQGRIIGKMESLGFELRSEAMLETLTLDVVKTSEIEGEFLNTEEVRSSIARKLGIEYAGSVESERNVDGVVEMMMDATQNYAASLSAKRLFNWHAALFPTGRSGIFKITVANWRKDGKGPMQVVSGPMGKEKVHFQAPDSKLVAEQMKLFLNWFNEKNNIDLILKSAIVHLWFLTIHPFDDGNGRIARALTDMLLARSDQSNQRFYSMSAQIKLERKKYYSILEKTQKGSLDITEWMIWFLNCLINSLKSSVNLLSGVLFKAEFWKKHSKTVFNERQLKMINKVLDGFDGKLTSSKWAKIAKCSKDTAIRDINDLIDKKILKKELEGGRSTNYELKQN